MKKSLPVFNIKSNFEIFEEAVSVLIDMKLLGKSNKRIRRPTGNEIERLKEGLLKRPQKNNTLICPYHSRSVTADFQHVRNELGIEGLRYHNLRREGASRLFDSIEEVAQVTGHRNLNILWQVYTQLFPENYMINCVKS